MLKYNILGKILMGDNMLNEELLDEIFYEMQEK